VNLNGSDLVLRPDVQYSDPQSLIGLNIATFPPGTIQGLVLKQWLNENGVDPAKVTIIGMSPVDEVIAITTGKVGGVLLPHPSPTIINDEGKGKTVIFSGKMWPDHACCSLLISEKLIRENPKLVKLIFWAINDQKNIYLSNCRPERPGRILWPPKPQRSLE